MPGRPDKTGSSFQFFESNEYQASRIISASLSRFMVMNHNALFLTKMHVSGAVPAHSTGHIDAMVPKG